MAVLKISDKDARKIIAYSQNSDGTLSPTPLAKASITTPVITPNLAARAWFFIQNSDGTLSPTVLS
jgi:hypothetical protein